MQKLIEDKRIASAAENIPTRLANIFNAIIKADFHLNYRVWRFRVMARLNWYIECKIAKDSSYLKVDVIFQASAKRRLLAYLFWFNKLWAWLYCVKRVDIWLFTFGRFIVVKGISGRQKKAQVDGRSTWVDDRREATERVTLAECVSRIRQGQKMSREKWRLSFRLIAAEICECQRCWSTGNRLQRKLGLV